MGGSQHGERRTELVREALDEDSQDMIVGMAGFRMAESGSILGPAGQRLPQSL